MDLETTVYHNPLLFDQAIATDIWKVMEDQTNNQLTSSAVHVHSFSLTASGVQNPSTWTSRIPDPAMAWFTPGSVRFSVAPGGLEMEKSEEEALQWLQSRWHKPKDIFYIGLHMGSTIGGLCHLL